MTAPTLVIVPLHDRPPNYEYPALLAQAAGFTPVLPPKAWLGTPWRAGNTDRLAAWLDDVAPAADGLVAALDTLGYGGLVNSRRSPDPAATVLARLHQLRELKQAHPALTILAYSVLMRISRANSAEEEKAYWESYGVRLFRMSYLEDRLAMMAGAPGDEDELATLGTEVPQEIVNDYLHGRARNHEVNRAMIEWTALGIFDYLIVPQDDTVEYGWNIAERRRLQRLVHQLRVGDRVSIYPGTDETDMLLIARYAAQRAGLAPRIATRYSSVRAGQIITGYEDRPMEELIKAHLGPLAGSLTTEPAQADVMLYVNTPAEVQGEGVDQYVLNVAHDDMYALEGKAQDAVEAYLRSPHLQHTLRERYSAQRDVHEFARSLAADMRAGRACAVVDVAYVNGADLALGAALLSTADVAQLAGYGGWNTAGNTLGSVLAHAVIRTLQVRAGATAAQLEAHVAFLFTRFVDDYLYQALVRPQVAFEVLPTLDHAPTMGDLGDIQGGVRDEVARRLVERAEELAVNAFVGRRIHGPDGPVLIDEIRIDNIFLPWRRLFEVGFDVAVRLQTSGDSTP